MLILYHTFCTDGFTAAWAAWRKFGDEPCYMAFPFGAPPHRIDRMLAKAEDQDVMVLDLCFEPTVMRRLLRVAKSVHVIDHHDTSMKWIAELGPHPKLTTDFSLDDSGASLTWKVLHGTPLPKLVQYVRDRDLWKHALPHTHEVTAALANTEKDFQVWDKLDLGTLVNEGRTVLRYVQGLVEFHAPHRHRFFATIDGRTWDGVAVCAPQYLKSDLAIHIADLASAPFGVVYQIGRGDALDNATLTYSFRVPANSNFHAADFCKAFGGGGHEKAAAVQIDVPGAELVQLLNGLNADTWSKQ